MDLSNEELGIYGNFEIFLIPYMIGLKPVQTMKIKKCLSQTEIFVENRN